MALRKEGVLVKFGNHEVKVLAVESDGIEGDMRNLEVRYTRVIKDPRPHVLVQYLAYLGWQYGVELNYEAWGNVLWGVMQDNRGLVEGKRVRSVKVGGLVYSVSYGSAPDHSFGYIDRNEQKIYINELPTTMAMETLWHEVIHAIGYMMGDDLEERAIDSLSAGVYRYVVDNKDWV